MALTVCPSFNAAYKADALAAMGVDKGGYLDGYFFGNESAGFIREDNMTGFNYFDQVRKRNIMN